MSKCVICLKQIDSIRVNLCSSKCRDVYKKAYQKTDKYKAYKKAYQKSDKHKAYRRAYQKEYRKSGKYKEYQKAYYQRTKKLGRQYLGIEINPEYVKLANERVAGFKREDWKAKKTHKTLDKVFEMVN